MQPDLIVIFIADLLEVKQNLHSDKEWRERVENSLKTLAEWRRESIDLIARDAQDLILSERQEPLDYVIYSKGHDPKTFVDLCRGQKPRIYISFAITQATEKQKQQVGKIKKRLQENFTCLDPYAIKDWEIITAYDDIVEKGTKNFHISSKHPNLKAKEIEDAVDELRAQTVFRDYSLVTSAHATVVLHIGENPSYGVMSEIIYTRSTANNPVYVLYPFKKRPSPFFEFYASRDHIIQNVNLEKCTHALIGQMRSDIEAGMWPRWKSVLKADFR